MWNMDETVEARQDPNKDLVTNKIANFNPTIPIIVLNVSVLNVSGLNILIKRWNHHIG